MRQIYWILGLAVLVPVVLLVLYGTPDGNGRSLLGQLSTLQAYAGQGERGAVLIRLENEGRQGSFPIRLDRISSDSKLKIEYNHVKNVSVVAIEIPACQGCDGAIRHENRIVDHREGGVYFGLDDSDAEVVTVRLHGFSGTRPIEIGISDLQVLDKSPVDSNFFFVLLMVGVAASFIIVGSVNGALLRAIFKETTPGNEGIFIVLGVFVFLIVMMGALLLLQTVPGASTGPLLLGLAMASLFALAIAAARVEAGVSALVRSTGPVIIFYLVASAVVAALLGLINGISLQEYHWSMIGKFRMFSGHGAHDNAFQYLNGLAIAENKPFSYFYHTNPLVKRLFYGVQDRQMLTGPMFAVYRVAWGALSPYVVNTYAFFQIFGTCLTMLMLFPLYAFFGRFFDQRIVILSLLVLALTTYVLGNLYYTWFKILGGALVLSGVFFLYLQPSKLTSWILAGLLWGLAANVHAGQVVIYPVVLLFFFIRQADFRDPGTLATYTVFAVLLTALVIAALMPWEIIKSSYYPGDQQLFREHFMRGERFTGNITGTMANFFERYSLTEQANKRLQQLIGVLRTEEVRGLLAVLRQWGWHEGLMEWNRLQYRYVAVMVYPLLLMLLIAWSGARLGAGEFTKKSQAAQRSSAALPVLYLAAGCVVWGLLVFFTKYEADSSSFVSPFAVTVANMFLIAFIASYSRLGLTLIAGYGALGLYKMAYYYSKIINCVPDHTFGCAT